MFRSCRFLPGFETATFGVDGSQSVSSAGPIREFIRTFNANLRKLSQPGKHQLPAEYVEGLITRAAKAIEDMLVVVVAPVPALSVRDALMVGLKSNQEVSVSDLL